MAREKKQNYIVRLGANIKKHPLLYALILPGFAFLVIFHYIPMYGIVIAFKDYTMGGGISSSPWIGLENFRDVFGSKLFLSALRNSILISVMKLIFSFPVPIVLAILLNEIRLMRYKKAIQTIIYLPHFISWVIISGILILFLSPTKEGLVNFVVVHLFKQPPIKMLTNKSFFRPLIVMSWIWKSAGWGTIIYMATISRINPEYYEVAVIDGASRFKQIIYITWPSMRPTVVVVLIMNLAWFLYVGFDQIYLLQNTLILDVAETLDTYLYKVGLKQGRFSFSTAMNIFQSLIGLILVLGSNYFAKKVSGSGLW